MPMVVELGLNGAHRLVGTHVDWFPNTTGLAEIGL